MRRMTMGLARRLAALLAAGWLGVASGGLAADETPLAVRPTGRVDEPAPVLGYDLFADGDALHLLVEIRAETPDAAHAVHRVSRDRGRTWSLPVAIPEGGEPPLAAKHGSAPQVAFRGDVGLAVWTGIGTGFMKRGPAVVAWTTDGGRTWTPGGLASPTGTRDSQAFLDLAVEAGGRFHLVWFDGRTEPRTMRHAWSDGPDVAWSAPTVIDGATCACCWNRLVTGEDGAVYALYRDEVPRDMAAAVLEPEAREWRALGRAGAFGWIVEGCPHVGGGLAASGTGVLRSLHATVWTAQEDAVGLYALRSFPNRGGWDAPIRLGSKTAKHSDLAAAGDRLVCAWDQWMALDDLAGVFVAESTDRGATWSSPVRISPPGVQASFPRALRVADRFVVFYVSGDPAGGTIVGPFEPYAPVAGAGRKS